MALTALIESLPDYCNDLKLNLSSVLKQPELSLQQTWGTVVASAIAAENPKLIQASVSEAKEHLSPETLQAAKAAAAIMGMNNVYYRFYHLCSNENYRKIPARLRMNILRSHGADALDFELWALAVSAINACSGCVDAHEKILREKGLSEESIIAAVRIASVMHAFSAALNAEGIF